MSKLLTVSPVPNRFLKITERLARHGYDVLTAETLSDAKQVCERFSPDAIVFDMTSNGDVELGTVKDLREVSHEIPVVVLTKRGALEQRVNCLQEGAGDYLMPPFRCDDLMARVATLIHRHRGEKIDGQLMFGNGVLRCDEIEVDLSKQTLKVAGFAVDIGTRPLLLMASLIRHQGEVVTRQQLAKEIWGHDRNSQANMIEVMINRLRTRFMKLNHPFPLKTVRKKGYLLDTIKA